MWHFWWKWGRQQSHHKNQKVHLCESLIREGLQYKQIKLFFKLWREWVCRNLWSHFFYILRVWDNKEDPNIHRKSKPVALNQLHDCVKPFLYWRPSLSLRWKGSYGNWCQGRSKTWRRFPDKSFPISPSAESLLLVACKIQVAASSACKTANYQHLSNCQSESSAPQRINRSNE